MSLGPKQSFPHHHGIETLNRLIGIVAVRNDVCQLRFGKIGPTRGVRIVPFIDAEVSSNGMV